MNPIHTIREMVRYSILQGVIDALEELDVKGVPSASFNELLRWRKEEAQGRRNRAEALRKKSEEAHIKAREARLKQEAAAKAKRNATRRSNNQDIIPATHRLRRIKTIRRVACR